ncbi:ice-binding protein [Flavobacterium sp.]|uniref:ice-binding protein n=1 Tax=Flavobacterium sp. TaxID=239 RepID=UPI002B4AFDBB|nr:ice-binding protein [Flavobacterium sp.]HLF52931.1 ice-binding family protein [Flavobacterium sp.]
MILKKTTAIIAMLSIVFMSACSEDQDTSAASAENATLNKSVSLKEESAGLNQRSGELSGVNLGLAGDFVILSKSGITDVFQSAITGDVGTSPITGAAILLECVEVTGTIYTVDAAGPACKITNSTRLTSAVGDMQTAYTDLAGRINPDFVNLGAGDIGGQTLTPGLYKWTSALLIPTDISISGGPDDIWIFQVDGTLDMSSGVNITLTNGAQAKNIYWQVADAVTLGTTSHFEGNILGATGINLKTGASINGRMLAQTAVTLQMNTVKKPQ